MGGIPLTQSNGFGLGAFILLMLAPVLAQPIIWLLEAIL